MLDDKYTARLALTAEELEWLLETVRVARQRGLKADRIKATEVESFIMEQL